jgi:large subunit ribosomal protein L19
MSTVIEDLEKRALKQRPRFAAGDRVRVHFQVVEGNRRRTQVFEGIVIKRQGSGARETFTVRKQSFGVGVERTFPLHSPKIEKLEIAARGDVRRAKLYYLREKVGKRARVAERRWGIEDDMVVAAEDAEAVDAEGMAVAEAEPEVVEPVEEEGEQPAEEQPAEEAPDEEQPADEAPAEEQPAEEEPAEEQPAEENAAEDADGGETAEAESEPERKAKADASPDEAED